MFPDVIHDDKPDFVLTNKDDSKFGVEVTEFYSSGSTARIQNKYGYLDQLLKGGKFCHKDDIANLRMRYPQDSNTRWKDKGLRTWHLDEIRYP